MRDASASAGKLLCPHPALCALIAETESRCFSGRALHDDDLDQVNAAGEIGSLRDSSVRDKAARIVPIIVIPGNVSDPGKKDP